MRARVVVGLAVLAVQCAASALAAEPAPFRWPDGHKAAVSLAYDDALDSQLDNAIPALDRHGFKGSFYLQLSRDPVRLRMDDWRRAARNGHELGNHTLFHQCSASLPDRSWVETQRNLDTTTAAQMQDQILLANTMLTAIDGQTERTLTIPCGDTRAQDGDYRLRVAPAFIAIKWGNGAVVPDMRTLDPAAVPVEAPQGLTGAQLIERVKEAGRKGTMVNFTFHGIGGDYLTISNQAHEELLTFLAAHRDEYWVDTFANLMRYVRQQQGTAAAATP